MIEVCSSLLTPGAFGKHLLRVNGPAVWKSQTAFDSSAVNVHRVRPQEIQDSLAILSLDFMGG